MAVKRTNRITSVVGGIERRLKSLESTSNLSIPAGSIVTEDSPDNTPNNNRVGELPPDVYRKIIGARIYGAAATGQLGTRVELYFEDDPDYETDWDIITSEDGAPITYQKIQVSGVNGYSNTRIVLSSGKIFNPIELVEPEGTDWNVGFRKQFDQTDWRQTPPVSATIRDVEANTRVAVASTIWYNPGVQDPDKTDKNGKDLIVTRAVDSAYAEGANVTVTFNASSHLFQVGDVISVDIPAPFIGLDYYGNNKPDGLFQITAVTSNTISYVLDEPVSTPQTYEYDETTRHYVYAVARPYVEDGTIWTDTQVEPNRVWVWKTYRWYNTADPIGDVTATQDGIAPSPITNLVLDSEVPVGDTSPNISLTWTPPTTRSNGASISGFLSGYEIWYKRSTDATWKREFVRDAAGTVTSHVLTDTSIVQNRTYNIRVYVIDIMSQVSTAVTDDILTATFSEVLNPPSKPIVSSRLGTIKVTWDGEDSAGNLPVPGVLYIEFHASNTSGFTPSDATLVGTAPSVIDGNYIVLSDLTYGSNYYFKTIFVRRLSPVELDKSLPSVQSDAIQVAPLVNTDVIANTISGAAIQSGTITASDKIIGNTITGALIQALAITAGKIDANAITADKLEAGAVSGVIIRGDVIKTANTGTRVELSNTGIYAYDGNTPVFSFNTSTASLTIGGYATNSNVSAVSNTATSASTTANTAITTANSKLDPANVISEINARFTSTGDSNTTTINGGAIRTDSLDALRIKVTDVFRYVNPSNNAEVRIGGQVSTSYIQAGIKVSPNGVLPGGFVGADLLGGFSIGNEVGNNTLNYRSKITFVDDGRLLLTGYSQISGAAAIQLETLGTSLESNGTWGHSGAFGASAGNSNSLSINGTGFEVSHSTGFGLRSAVESTYARVTVWQGPTYLNQTVLNVFGNATARAWNLSSSLRYKNSIEDYVSAPFDKILNLRPVTYQHNGDPENVEKSLGLIAEEVDALGLKYLVGYDDQGRPDSLNYSLVSVLLIPILKDLTQRLERLENLND